MKKKEFLNLIEKIVEKKVNELLDKRYLPALIEAVNEEIEVKVEEMLQESSKSRLHESFNKRKREFTFTSEDAPSFLSSKVPFNPKGGPSIQTVMSEHGELPVPPQLANIFNKDYSKIIQYKK